MATSSHSFSSALADWQSVLSPGRVLTEPADLAPYLDNVSGLTREVWAVLRPTTTLEVQSIVLTANRHRIPLYPLSCGRNWGYGSRLPVRDRAVIVDLALMNRIRNEEQISVTEHYALIEPGVTQAQMVAALDRRGLPLVLNATAAGAETSILGNSLDRGFGYFAMRPEDVCGMEVVLGNGEILRTGYGHYPNAVMTNQYKYGLGPSLDGLFFQSNFGIVTCASLHLHPKRQVHVTLLAQLNRDEDFPKLVDGLATLRREAVLESVVHIGSSRRIGITLGPIIYNFLVREGQTPGPKLRKKAEAILARKKFASWTAVGGLFGTEAEIKARLREIKQVLGGFCTINVITREKVEEAESALQKLGAAGINKRALLQGSRALMDFCLGIPSDGALFSPRWALGELPRPEMDNLDQSRVGLLFCCPALPIDGKAALVEVKRAEAVFARFGFAPYATLNVVNTKALLCILNLVFDRSDPEATARAHVCVDALFAEWAQAGIYPYRLGIQSMEQFVDPADPFWKVVASLKQTFDPNNLIAPGRYNVI